MRFLGCTATVEIAERNFEEKQVVLHVQNAQGTKKSTPKVSAWKEKYNRENPNLSTHTATVTFEEDGEYTFCDVSHRKEDFSIGSNANIVQHCTGNLW